MRKKIATWETWENDGHQAPDGSLYVITDSPTGEAGKQPLREALAATNLALLVLESALLKTALVSVVLPTIARFPPTLIRLHSAILADPLH